VSLDVRPTAGREPHDERTVFSTELAVERAGSPRALSERRLFERLEAELSPGARAASRPLLRLCAKRALDRADLRALGLESRTDTDDPRERAALAGVLDATLGELLGAGTTPDDLERTGTRRGSALAAVMQAVFADLSSVGRFDSRAVLSAGSRALLAAGDPIENRALPDVIELFGYADLEPGRIALWLELHAAMRARGRRGVSLRWPRLDQGGGPLATLAEALEQRLGDEPDPFEIEWEDPHPPLSIRAIDAHGSEAEARAVVRAVLDGLAAGARPDRICVVVPSADENFVGPLRAHFDEAKLAISEAHGPPVEHAPEAKLFGSLLAMAATRLDRDAIVELLRTPGLHPGSLVERAEEARATDRAAALAARLREVPVAQHRTGELFVEALMQTLASDRDKGVESRWMVPALERLNAELTSLRDAKTIEAALSGLLGLAERLRLGDPSAAEVRAALLAEEGRHASSSMRAVGAGAVAVRAMTEALTGMRDAARLLGTGGQPVDLGELAIDWAELSGATRTAARGGSGRTGAIRIGSLREVLGVRHDLVVVTRLGATRYFGRKAPSLLDEATRRLLPVKRRPRTERERLTAREAELAWALSSADSVVMTHASTDDDGRSAEPPHARLLAALAAGAPQRVEPASRLARSASLISARARDLWSLSHGGPTDEALGARVEIERDRYEFFVRPSTAATRFSGRIGAPLLPALLDRFGGDTAERALAVGVVERTVLCAFRAFAERVLGSRRSEDATDALSPLERGDLLHRALHAAFECERQLPPSVPLAERLERARVAAEAACDLDAAGSAIRRDGRARTVADAIEVLRADLEGDRAFVYREGERPFGREYAPPWGPLVLTGPAGASVFVEGRLDRVDQSADGSAVRVIDYKAGSPKARKIGETDFQVPLYALVATRLGAQRTLGAYASVGQGGQLTLRPKKEADQELDLELVGQTAAAAVERVWSGVVAPRPRTMRVCDHCNARGLCRRPAVVPADDDGWEPAQ